MRYWTGAVCLCLLAGCHGGEVTDEEDAEYAYLGLDQMVVKAMNLGMQGYNQASSANIADQSGEGDVSGSLVVGGQVDQGSSDNKELRLDVSLDDYADLAPDDDHEEGTHYTTATPATLDLSLRGIPDGTFEGTFAGTFSMEGDLEGEVTLDLTLAGDLEPDPDVPDGIQRVAESTTITGTATSDYGTYDVDLVR